MPLKNNKKILDFLQKFIILSCFLFWHHTNIMKILKISLIAILVVIIIYLFVSYIPVIFITKEGQTCLNEMNCMRLKPVCDEINKDIPKNTLGLTEPMCNNYKCECEWYGNLLNL